MQKHALHNEEMKTIINILIISDTSKDFFICFNFFLLKQCYAGDVTWHFTFTSLPFLGRVFVGFFGVFFFC